MIGIGRLVLDSSNLFIQLKLLGHGDQDLICDYLFGLSKPLRNLVFYKPDCVC